ncbi:hypothetical protein DRE_00706 [Drechslerella stenobrocha 248]|uniref:Altered inheritance of mitochondria protein 6 n=1 Tax=Drechslerella stenobrocha 248 TaxID=1043628 RepID=W7HYP2_9PEZI|nr:hypothetical protein DRE_00706 [Drechslerella stenobrocha 248]
MWYGTHADNYKTLPVGVYTLDSILGFIAQVFFAPPILAYGANAVWSGSGHIAQFVEQWSQKTGLGNYPTSFTRGIVPKPIHSHNDYWQEVPFYKAISVGAISVEADVYLRDGDLLVGHEEAALSPNRTLRSLYINPIIETLERQNPESKYTNETHCGIFDQSCHRSLYLWVDVKEQPEKIWPIVVAQLAPLRERDWLTKWDGKKIIPGLVTVISTGRATYKVVVGNKTRPRDYFVDAPLLEVGTPAEPKEKDGKTPLYDRSTSIFAVGHLGEAVGRVQSKLTGPQLKKVEQLVKNAHSRGLQTRIWDTPGWSSQRRRNVWRQLADIPVGLLNVDDLEDAAFGDW